VLSNVSERKRVIAHLTSEVSVSDAISKSCQKKKRLKSKAVVEEVKFETQKVNALLVVYMNKQTQYLLDRGRYR
jgi:hypothetical protein